MVRVYIAYLTWRRNDTLLLTIEELLLQRYARPDFREDV